MTPDELWLDIKDTILTTAKKYIPLKRKKKTSLWLSQEVQRDRRSQLPQQQYQPLKGIKDLTSRRSPRLPVIKDENGIVLTESDDIKDRWRNYCEGLYASKEEDSREEIHTQEDEPDILRSEVIKAIQKFSKPTNLLELRRSLANC